ncbi:MAG: hypothetical protein AB1679_02400 [Actinomycetota bacterium]
MAPQLGVSPDDPWGEQDAPAVLDVPALPPSMAELAALRQPVELPPGERFVHPQPEDLPEVAGLVAAGWRVAEPSPMWSFLPAVWPPPLRCWVVDRLPRFSRSSGRQGKTTVITPWTTEVADDIRSFVVELLSGVGLPPPPPGRIWLLRSPWPSVGVGMVMSLIAMRAPEGGGRGGMLEPALVDAAREVLGWDDERVWGWWPGERGEIARAWRALGRVGEDAADVIAARLSPELLAAHENRGFDETTALAWTDVLDLGGLEGLERAAGWAQLGLSPEDVGWALSDADPADVAIWLADGFDLDEVRALQGLPLGKAKAWKAAGVPADEVTDLLCADQTLTPEEARRFTELDIPGDDRRRWVEYGFDASVARAWTDLDVVPNEARVWRAAGFDPATAALLLREIPAGSPRIPVGDYRWAMTGGVWFGGPTEGHRPGEPIDFTDIAVRRSLYFSVDDPPGTRGSQANRR